MKKKTKIFKNTIIQRNPNQVFSNIDGEVVMLSIEFGEYINLEDVGSQIWNNIENPCTFGALIESLMETYTVEEQTCYNDTKDFILELYNANVIQILDE